ILEATRGNACSSTGKPCHVHFGARDSQPPAKSAWAAAGRSAIIRSALQHPAGIKFGKEGIRNSGFSSLEPVEGDSCGAGGRAAQVNVIGSIGHKASYRVV